MRRWEQAVLVVLTLSAVLVYGYGVRGNLPYFNHVDEPHFVGKALGMVASGKTSPEWFGVPGSTIIYPLWLLFGVWYAVTGDGVLTSGNPELYDVMGDGAAEFYLLGRLFNLCYAVGAIPLVYAVARRAFDSGVALMATLFALPCPIIVSHAKIVRTDVAALFFTLFALWRCQHAGASPTRRNDWLAGLAIGLACATRYFSLALTAVLGLIALQRAMGLARQGLSIRPAVVALGHGLAAMIVGFLLATPYFLPQIDIAWRNIALEARGEHLGADGLSPIGNLTFYLRDVIPAQSINLWLALAGLALAAWRRANPGQLQLVVFGAGLLGGISLLSLHWVRWAIPLFPLLAMFAAYALCEAVRAVGDAVGATPRLQVIAGGVLAVLICVPQARVVASQTRAAMRPNTRVVARDWMLSNLAPTTRVALEWYGAALVQTPFDVEEEITLANRSLEEYRADQRRILVTSSTMVDRYRAAPDRYTAECAFYSQLESTARLLIEVGPNAQRYGPTIRIYELPR